MFDGFYKYLSNKVNVTDDQFKEIEKLLTFKKVPRGASLALNDSIYWGAFVMHGCLRSFVKRNDNEHIMQFAPENWWLFGTSSSMMKGTIICEIDAIEDSKIALFNHQFMANVENIVPGAYQMHRNLEHNAIRSLQKRIFHLLTATAEERYLFFIETYPQLATRLPQWMIASYLGMEPPSLSRVRKNLSTKMSGNSE